MVNEVLPDGVVPVQGESQLELGADAVNRGNEDGLPHPGKIRAKQPAEAADLAEDVGVVRRGERAAQPALEPIAEVHVHAGAGVGFGGESGGFLVGHERAGDVWGHGW